MHRNVMQKSWKFIGKTVLEPHGTWGNKQVKGN